MPYRKPPMKIQKKIIYSNEEIMSLAMRHAQNESLDVPDSAQVFMIEDVDGNPSIEISWEKDYEL